MLVCDTASPASIQSDGYSFALTTDLSQQQELQKLLPSLINGNSKFLLMIDEHLNIQESYVMDAIVNCMFSTNYNRVDDRPVIGFIQGNAQTEINSLHKLQTLLGYLNAQGWASIVCWNFVRNNEGLIEQHSRQPLVVNHLETENEFADKYLSELNLFGEYILFHQPDFEKTIELEQAFFNTLQEVLLQYPLLKKGLSDYVQEKKSASRLKAKNATLEEKLANAEKTISVIRSKYKDDYENLFKWYHNEYEILPLWYKRFGHILKVLTGKRTFRSLFNDDVKKYKT